MQYREMLQYLMVMGVVGYAQGSLEKLNSICNPYNSSQELTNCNYLNMTQKTLLRQFLIDSGPADDVLNVTLNVKNPIQELMAFPAIADLFTLFLRHNSIKKIGSAAFQRLMSLLQLDLSNNDLTDVDFMSGGIDLPLEALYLGHNRIRSVDQRAFDRLPRLKVLHLNNNPIVMMDDRFVTAISRLQNLQELILANSELELVANEIFESKWPWKLRRLDLHGNRLTELPRLKQTHLEELNLSDNNLTDVDFLTALDDGHIDFDLQLKVLYLANNRIRRLGQMAFERCPAIQVLVLNNNPIMENDRQAAVALVVISKLKKLKELNLAETGLKSIPDLLFLKNGRNLRRLTLNGNQLTRIPRDLQLSLQELHLSNNNLSDVDFLQGHATDLPLMYLDLSFNHIRSLGGYAFDSIPLLRLLYLNNNPIGTLDDESSFAIRQLKSLEVLNLGETRLESIPDWLFERNGKSLRFLDLHGNHLMQVPRALQKAVTLVSLNLDGNPIRALDATSFVGLGNLIQLDVSNLDSLQLIDTKTFTPLRNLKYIDCSDNHQLKNIHPDAFHNVTTLALFAFNSNGVESIPPYLLPWDTLAFYSIHNNSKICSTLNVVICYNSKLVWVLRDNGKALHVVTCIEENKEQSYSNETGCPSVSASSSSLLFHPFVLFAVSFGIFLPYI